MWFDMVQGIALHSSTNLVEKGSPWDSDGLTLRSSMACHPAGKECIIGKTHVTGIQAAMYGVCV